LFVLAWWLHCSVIHRMEEAGGLVGPRRPGDEVECVRRLKSELAFKMLRSGRSDLIPHALQLLPSSKVILQC
jgi:hypothetical protein